MLDTGNFNIVAKILVTDFHLDPALVTPETTLSELGLDSLALMEFVFAVEDAFHLRIAPERLDPREAGITLERLCEVIGQIAVPPSKSSIGLS